MNIVLNMQRAPPAEAWALCPDHNFPRLIRFDLPSNNFELVAALDFDQNLLRINRAYYDGLTEQQRHRVLLARTEFTYLKDLQ